MITTKGKLCGIYNVIKRDKKDSVFLKKLGERIKQIRKEKGIKQKDLGYSLDIEKSNMSRIESGNTNPTIILLKKIAEELNVSINELINF
jgi:transcriptional regulator with XRE-family HTH domain